MNLGVDVLRDFWDWVFDVLAALGALAAAVAVVVAVWQIRVARADASLARDSEEIAQGEVARLQKAAAGQEAKHHGEMLAADRSARSLAERVRADTFARDLAYRLGVDAVRLSARWGDDLGMNYYKTAVVLRNPSRGRLRDVQIFPVFPLRRSGEAVDVGLLEPADSFDISEPSTIRTRDVTVFDHPHSSSEGPKFVAYFTDRDDNRWSLSTDGTLLLSSERYIGKDSAPFPDVDDEGNLLAELPWWAQPGNVAPGDYLQRRDQEGEQAQDVRTQGLHLLELMAEYMDARQAIDLASAHGANPTHRPLSEIGRDLERVVRGLGN